MCRLLMSIVVAGLTTGLAPTAEASTLWLGDDMNNSVPLLETTTGGAVLRSLPGNGVGFGIDLANNWLYVNNTFFSAARFDLTTLLPVGAPVPFPGVASEDMSFDGTNLLVGDFSGQRVLRINPITGVQVSAVNVPFQPLGLSWDGGTGFWASPFANGGAATHFDSAGNVLSSFVPFANNFAGGIGFDPTDGTLYIGTGGGLVSHFTTAGVLLGSFSTGDGRFIDGLEVRADVTQQAVPEPASLFLVGSGAAWLVRRVRRSRSEI
jgi:PEP-CTERM motif